MNKESNLKRLRREKGFSQEGLAEVSGISIRTIQRLEKGLSVGSVFTLDTLAKALCVETKALVADSSIDRAVTEDQKWLRWMNLSALGVIFLPLSNIVFPAIVFWKRSGDSPVRVLGSRILSFQILWTVITVFLMLAIPAILLLLFRELRGGGIPLAVPVYALCALLNVYVTVRVAFSLGDQSDFIKRMPDFL